ncbi:MAG: hypothetical protein VYB54_12610 [Pseudomonadota bacterium]|nr:hypothetical protein [Pseudomonadota bacterium]
MSLMTSRLPRLLRRHPRIALAVAAALTLGWLADDWAFHKVPSVELQAWCYSDAEPGDPAYILDNDAFSPLEMPLSTEFRMIVAALTSTKAYDRALVDAGRIRLTPAFSVNSGNKFAFSRSNPAPEREALYNLTRMAVMIIARKRIEDGIEIDPAIFGGFKGKSGKITVYPENNCKFIQTFATRDGEYAKNPKTVFQWHYGDSWEQNPIY